MSEGMKSEHEEKLDLNEIELEIFKIAIAKAEAFTATLMKDKHKKEIEWAKYQNSINKLKINHNQESIELKKNQTEIITLKNVLEGLAQNLTNKSMEKLINCITSKKTTKTLSIGWIKTKENERSGRKSEVDVRSKTVRRKKWSE